MVAVPLLRLSWVLPTLLLPYAVMIRVSLRFLSVVLPATMVLRRLSCNQLGSVNSFQLAMRFGSNRCCRVWWAAIDSLAQRMVSIVPTLRVKREERNMAVRAAATVVSMRVNAAVAGWEE